MASAVLQHVTSKKLAKLADQQTKYEQQRKDLENSDAKDSDRLAYSRRLLEGIKKIKAGKDSASSLTNLKLFLKQAEHDASVPSSTLLQWHRDLERILSVRSERFSYASLFGQLVTEWLQKPNEATKQLQGAGNDSISEDSLSSVSDFEPVGRKEMHDQRKIWESIVFKESNVNPATLKDYLTNVFGSEKSAIEASETEVTPMDKLRKRLHRYRINPITEDSIKGTIRGILSSDLFAGSKRDALLDLKDRSAVLSEMVDVLNMEIRTLQHWKWEPAAVPIVQRRQVNGKYRFFMDEEIHQAILIQHVGLDVAQTLKPALEEFYAQAWIQRSESQMTQDDVFRRAYFLQQLERGHYGGPPKLEKPVPTIAGIREREFSNTYFLVQMPRNVEEGARDYNDDSDDTKDEKYGKSPIELKQDLLEYLTTDMLIQLDIKKQFSVILSDFSWFGPSLPHETILAVMKFFGFRENILSFFKTFLEAPVCFSQDGPNAAAQIRKAGAPMSHALSDVMGESILFCLDYAVNKATKGANLLRLHDDLWFWGDQKDCEIAWKTIQQFSKATGLELNMDKTGSVTIADNKSVTAKPALPEGPVRWGFLVLDATKRQWVIDRSQVDEHIKELRLQLEACNSVFAFVQAWNSYVSRFFTNNFGRAANCHGPEHLNAIIATFEHIQKQLFPSGSVTTHLKDMIATRFAVASDSIPTGFLYFPTELGGLDLRNPFIPLLARLTYEPDDPDLTPEERLRTSKSLKPAERLALARLREKQDYDKAKTSFEQHGTSYTAVNNTWRPADCETFFALDEYSRFREETSFHLINAAAALKAQPDEVTVERTADVGEFEDEARRLLPAGWMDREYNRWILALYGPEVVQRFGRLCIGDRELLPVGLVNVMRGEKVRWMG